MAHPATPTAEEAGVVKREYSRLAKRYDRRWAGYIRATVQETQRRLRIEPGDRVLDVGCGTGVLLASIVRATPGASLVGLDLCHEMLRVASRRVASSVCLVTADVERLPFESGSFDVVVSSSSFHYWSDPLHGLVEIRRVLSEAGRLVVSDWCNDYWTCRVCDHVLRWFRRAHHRSYRSDECTTFVQRADLKLERLEKYKINWFWGLMTVSATRAAV